MKAGCYAVLVLADNATFLLAVNRMVGFCTESQLRPHMTFGSSTDRSLDSKPGDCGFDSHLRQYLSYVCDHLRHSVGMELSSLGFGERATPMSHSLTKISHPADLCYFNIELAIELY